MSINESQNRHYQRAAYKLEEDPWENYMFYDAKHLIYLICHSEPMSIEKQVILAKFIEHSMLTETIS